MMYLIDSFLSKSLENKVYTIILIIFFFYCAGYVLGQFMYYVINP